MYLSKQIQIQRQRLGMTQDELAAKLYVSRQTVSNWENERNYPDVENLLLLSVLFDLSLDELVKGDLKMMKNQLVNAKMDCDTKVMLGFLILGVVSIGPSLFLPDYWWMIITGGCWIIAMMAALHLDYLKRRTNVRTYREILAFMRDEDVVSARKLRNRWRDAFTATTLMIVFGVIAGVLALLASLPYILTR